VKAATSVSSDDSSNDIVINEWRLAPFDTKPANSIATLARESLREPRSR
jgi:hypothetical protein